MRKHEGGQADEINEERKGERQIAFVHEKKIGERETLAGVGRRVDADVHRSSLSDPPRRANRQPQSERCYFRTVNWYSATASFCEIGSTVNFCCN